MLRNIRLSQPKRKTAMVLGILLTLSLVMPSFPPAYAAPRSPDPMSDTMPTDEILPPGSGPESGSGLQLVLSEGAELPSEIDSPPPGPTLPLSPQETAALLDRLPPLPEDDASQVAFRLPPEPLPPPRTGETIQDTFPPQDTGDAPASVDSGPLQVLRYAPEGEVRLAPFLNVTFNQPMVPLATQQQLSASDVPVRLTPELPGVWQWIGTQTLSFEYAGDEGERFPMATEYVVEIPAGTKSATGAELAESVRWTFTTPAPRVLRGEPSYSPSPRDPLLFVGFDQEIDPAAVLETVQVTAGGRTYPVRLATDEEIQADKSVQNLVKNAVDDRWVAFRSDELFPAATTVSVNVGPSTPSAEGPLTTAAVQSYSFQTYAPLRIDRHRCGYYDNAVDCPPLTPFEIVFNNPLDANAFDESWIRVQPEIPGQVIELFGSVLRISGQTSGRTTYMVNLDGAIRDIFGQTLGADASLTFETGSAPQALLGLDSSLVTLDPSLQTPAISFYSINYERLRVRAFRVTPADWPTYQQYLRDYRYDGSPFNPPGQEVLSKVITIDSVPDTLTETTLDLSSALEGNTGHLIVVVDHPRFTLPGRDRSQILQAWVQATQIGLDAFVDHSEMVAWATNLSDGEPLEGTELKLGAQATVRADEHGLARIALPQSPAAMLVAQAGSDTAFLPQSLYYWGDEGWRARQEPDSVYWHVFDDRAIYRPGEEVHVKGWVRKIGSRQDAEVSLMPGASSVRYQLFDSQGNQLVDEVTDVNDLGGFDLAILLPENANLGFVELYLSVTTDADAYGTDYFHTFQIQEFRRPEFEVTTRPQDEGPYFVGGDASVSVHAAYFAGGPLPNADTNWTVTSSPGSYSPPNWPDFIFGEWTPWWGYSEPYYDPYYGPYSGSGYTQASYSARTDAAGAHYLNIAFPDADEPRPYSVRAEAVVMDVSRQAWASATNLLVHPAELYVGLRSDRSFVDAGEPLIIDAIVTDLDGNAVEDRPVEITAIRLDWKYEKGVWVEKEMDPQTCTVGSQNEPVSCTFDTEIGGEYRITAAIRDAMDRVNRSEFTRWVSGGQRPPARNVEQEQAILIPDKETYQPGDVAEILVQSPFPGADGLLSLRRNGIVSTEPFRMDGSTHTVQVPILDEYTPNLHVSVDLVGAAPRVNDNGEQQGDLPARPAFASGALNLEIPPLSRTLTLTVEPAAKELQPGENTSLSVSVVDVHGEPVENAELAVVVVDEAILALTNYALSNPLDSFYRQLASGVDSYYGRNNVELARADLLGIELAAFGGGAGMEEAAADMAEPMGAPSPTMAFAMPAAEAAATYTGLSLKRGDTGANEEAPSPIVLRADFNPLAVFEPAIRTDANGRATVGFALPDNLTRYRVMVSAVAGNKYFGAGEANVTARLPLMVRPAAPRFLNFGDRFELPVVVQNQTDAPLTVSVALRAANLDLADGLGQQVEIPANDRREVRFPAATVSAGTVHAQIAATADAYADASTIELPVYTPATTEAFATYGVIDASGSDSTILQPVLAPTDVFTQFGGLEINTSSTALQALTDAVIYLVSYPFECSEQIASRILGIASLRDVLTAFEAEELPSPEELNAAIEKDIVRLQQMQNPDGGFPIWSVGMPSVPYYSIHAAHALQQARVKDYLVSDDTLQRALQHLRDIESYYPSWYSNQTRHALSAYALYVRDLMGDVDTTKARGLLNSMPMDDQSLEAIAWLWQVLSGDPASTQDVDAIRKHINNRAVETAGAANFFTSYGDDQYIMLHSDRRTDAIVLDAMINDEPDNDLVPKLVNGLLAHRTAGHWRNTQENVFVLLALDRYFNTFEAQTPDFVARMWLGDTYMAEHAFEGYTTDSHATTVPMSYLTDAETEDGTLDFILQKDGVGRLYYRLGLRYAPNDLALDPLDRGFTVQRAYEAVDNPEDVQRDENGIWRIKAGARVRVRLDMVANTRRYHVALVDPLPAGLESVNPALAVAESLPGPNQIEPAPYARWWGPWYEHQNLRDARAEAFASLLWEGVYQYSYIARATTPGDYVVPPAKAEEMYSPEVFGRSASDRVIVE